MDLIDRMAFAMVRKTAREYGDPGPVNPDLTLTRTLVWAAIGEMPEGIQQQIRYIREISDMKATITRLRAVLREIADTTVDQKSRDKAMDAVKGIE